MTLVKLLLALVLAVALQVLGLRLFAGFAQWVDPFLVVTVLFCFHGGPVTAMLAGTVAGLAADTLSGGGLGLYGFANTLTAFAGARLRQRLVIQQWLQRALLFMLAAALQQAVVALVAFLLIADAELPAPVSVVAKLTSTALIGLAAVALGRRLRSWGSRWRELRHRRLTIAR